MRSDFFIHSPFSFFVMTKEENKVLLLQFILSELFSATKFSREHAFDFIFSSKPLFYPYDWSYQIGCFNKIQEHTLLLKHAFESFQEPISFFDATLKKTIEQVSSAQKKLSHEIGELFNCLFPLIESCKNNENLLLFLLKNHKEILEISTTDKIESFFPKLYPEGLDSLHKLISENYQKRGMISIVSEAKALFEELDKIYVKS